MRPRQPELEFDEAAHVYRWNGRIVPSVTQCLDTLGLSPYKNVPTDVLDLARARGQAVHDACFFYHQPEFDWASVDPAIAGYVRAWECFVQHSGLEWEMSETPLGSPLFAGTPDGVGRCFDRDSVIDIKTYKPRRVTGMQLAGYQGLCRALDGKPRRRLAIWLKPDSKWEMTDYADRDDEAAFLAALTMTHWLMKGERYGDQPDRG